MTTSMYIHQATPLTSSVNAGSADIHPRDLVRVYTAQTTRREELELAHQALHALFVHSPHGLVLLDDNGCVHLANQPFAQLVGVAATLVHGRMLHDLLPQVALHNALERLRNDEHAPNQLELMLRQPTARLFHVTIARLMAGPLRGWLIELQDQTARQRLENQKIAFIDIAAHELRTPLAAVIGFAELLSLQIKQNAEGHTTECLEGILKASRNLKTIVDEMLQFAQLNKGTAYTSDHNRFDLIALLRDICTDLQEKAAQKEVYLHLVHTEPTLMMTADPVLVHSLFSQLVTNGIKFNQPGGHVSLEVMVLAEKAVVRITDSGIGMATLDLARIFTPFAQLDDHFTRSSGGLGLGLSIVRRTLDQLGGTIQVQSQLDVGTAFVVQLPHHQPIPGNEVQQLRVRLDASHQQTQQYARDLHQLYGELQQHWLATLNSITEALEARDIYTRGHTDRVTALALRLARHMGYAEADLSLLEIAGRIHDIGMIGIPDTILNKTGSLSQVEKAIARQHVALGRKIVEPLDFLHDAAQIAFAHHERWDGQGYPNGLAGEAIPHAARILAVADAFDAITSPRAYREARSPQQALAIIRAGAGQQWDAGVVQALLELMAS